MDDIWKFKIRDVDVKDEAGHKPLQEQSTLMQVIAYNSADNVLEPKLDETQKNRKESKKGRGRK